MKNPRQRSRLYKRNLKRCTLKVRAGTLCTAVLAIFQLGNAQALKVVASIADSDRSKIEYRDELGYVEDSYSMDSANIYVFNENKFYLGSPLYEWRYKEPYSEGNPKVITGFRSYPIRRWDNLLVNRCLNLLDLQTRRIERLLDDTTQDYGLLAEKVIQAVDDSTIYWFWVRGGHIDSGLQLWDLRQIKKHEKILANFVMHVRGIRGRLSDIFVESDTLYALVDFVVTDSHSECNLFAWDIGTDTKVFETLMPDVSYDHILGIDNRGMVCVRGGWDFDCHIGFASRSRISAIIDVREMVEGMPFFKANSFLEPKDYEGARVIIGSMSPSREMHFMVKTVKGLFFLEYLDPPNASYTREQN